MRVIIGNTIMFDSFGQRYTRNNNKFDKRRKTVKLNSAKGRKASSTRWLRRQLNDPFVAEAKIRGYRSRSAFKLIQLDDKFQFLRKGHRVVDLGAAPGGWTQVLAERCINGRIVALDIEKIESISGTTIICGDFFSSKIQHQLKTILGSKANVVLTDMAEPATGHRETDHFRIAALFETAVEFATDILVNGGTFVGKVFHGGAEKNILQLLKLHFTTVQHFKPLASHKESPEIYLVARGYKN